MPTSSAKPHAIFTPEERLKSTSGARPPRTFGAPTASQQGLVAGSMPVVNAPVLPALAGAILVYMRFSMLPEIQTMSMGFNLYLLYLAAVPAILAVLFTGGLARTFRGPAAYCWIGYVGWVVLGIPFSSWRGDSAHIVNEYIRANVPMLFVIAGLAVNWKICKWMMFAIALGGVTNLIAARIFMADVSGRMGLSLSTVGNPNDFAAHLLIVTPFILWLGFRSKSYLLRVAALGGIGLSTYYILATASRGALISLGVDAVILLWKGTPKMRIGFLVVAPIIAIGLVAVTNQSILVRLGSFSSSDANASVEALDSTESRKYLLGKAFEYTARFPIFGVGAGQFGIYEGFHSSVVGTHGQFHGAHNTYMQAAAECGIPAFLFMVAGVITTLATFASTLKDASKRPDCEDIRLAAFCCLLGMAGFCTAIFFLNFAYAFYSPAMGGLAVALRAAANQEFQSRQPGKPAVGTQPPLAVPFVRRTGYRPARTAL